jgi:hypothetical protein
MFAKPGKTARTYNVPSFIDVLYEGSDSPVAPTKISLFTITKWSNEKRPKQHFIANLTVL